MTKIAQLDNTKTPAVVLTTFDFGQDQVPAHMQPPDYIDVTTVNPTPVQGYTYDGTSWTPGTPQQQQANAQALQGKAQNALAGNATFLGLAAPTNAQTLAQVQSLTKQVNAVIRMVLGQFDSTAGT